LSINLHTATVFYNYITNNTIRITAIINKDIHNL